MVGDGYVCHMKSTDAVWALVLASVGSGYIGWECFVAEETDEIGCFLLR